MDAVVPGGESLHDHAHSAEFRVAALGSFREKLVTVDNLRHGDVDVALAEQIASARSEVADQHHRVEETEIVLHVEVVVLRVDRVQVVDKRFRVRDAAGRHLADVDRQRRGADRGAIDVRK